MSVVYVRFKTFHSLDRF